MHCHCCVSMLFSTGAVQLGGVGVALSVFGSATKLMNVPLLSVTTQIVATAVGSNEGVPQPHVRFAVQALLYITLHLRSLNDARLQGPAFWLATEVLRYNRLTGCSPLRKRRVIGLAASSALFIAAVVGATQARPRSAVERPCRAPSRRVS